MVAVKERMNSLTNRVTQDHKMRKTGGGRNFKIYAEVDNVKSGECGPLANESKRKSIPHNRGNYQLNVKDSKSDVKNLEKGKNKIDTSVKINVRRKVLADISNAKGSFSKIVRGSGSIPEDTVVSAGIKKTSCSSEKFLRGKVTQASGENHNLKKQVIKNMKATSDEQATNVQGRSSMITTGRTFSRIPLPPTRKSFPVLKQVNKKETNDMKGKMKLNLIQASGENNILKRQVNKNMKAASNEQGTRVQGRFSMTTTGRKSVTNPLPPASSRKSLPVLKKINKLASSDAKKDNSEKLEKFSVKHGFPVKPRVSRTAVPLASSSSSRPLKNRVSYDFVVMTSRAQPKVSSGALSRKSAKSTLKIASAVSNTRRNSKSKCTFGTNKQRSDAAISSKRKQDIVRSSLSAETSSVVSSEKPSQKDVLSGSNINFDSTMLDVIARSKSDRRNSFTFSLMSGSKFPKERGKTQENLPNIYDVRNHLEVSDYVDDIYQYYWVMEGQNPVLKDYMEIQTEINPQMRGILINWLVEVHHKFDLMQETLFLMVTLLDRYLSFEIIKKNEMQLVGLTALLLASKYEDFWHPRVTDLISIAAESYTRDLMLGMEKAILKKLKFRLNEPTLYVFMLRFVKAAQSEAKFEHLAFYLIELCLVEYEALNYKPSMLCASAIYLARCTMKMTPTWTPLLEKHTRYYEPQLRNCTQMILKFHKAARTSMLKVSYEKYMKRDYNKVAAIKPLDILPL